MIAREVAVRDPGVTTIVLDQDMVGSGASRRSAGLHLPCGGTERVRRMAARSQEYYRRLGRHTRACRSTRSA